MDKWFKVWRGPFTVVEILGDNVFKIFNLNIEEKVVHASRLYFYGNKETDLPPVEYLQALHRIQWTGLELGKINIVRIRQGLLEVQIKWYGFKEMTWETVENVLSGAHLLLYSFIVKNKEVLDEIVFKSFYKRISAKEDIEEIEKKIIKKLNKKKKKVR